MERILVMFGDLFQLSYQRRMVKAHAKTWMICHVLNRTTNEIKEGLEHLALAVPCSDRGEITLPSAVEIIQFTDEDLITELPRESTLPHLAIVKDDGQ